MVWRNDQVSEEETVKILEIARECLGVEGDFVEMGCYRGDTSLALAEVLEGEGKSASGEEVRNVGKARKHGIGVGGEVRTKRRLWLYDSFEGLPAKGEEDISVAGIDFREGVLAVSKREVKARFLRSGLKVPKIVKGWFSDLTAEDLPEKIAFAFLDGDLYESIRDSFRLVWPKMTDGGAIVVHDYANEALPGVAKAVEEWATENDVEISRYETLAILGKSSGKY